MEAHPPPPRALAAGAGGPPHRTSKAAQGEFAERAIRFIFSGVSYVKSKDAGQDPEKVAAKCRVTAKCDAEQVLGKTFVRHHGRDKASTQYATPVGSGTVARTEPIPIHERAEAAVIAWMRHQTTAHDEMQIPRIKGKRRDTRRLLAGESRQLLEAYRAGRPVAAGTVREF